MLLQHVDQLALGVGLREGDLDAEFGGALAALLLEVGEGLVAVDLRLALAEEIEVGAVEYQHAHRGQFLQPGPYPACAAPACASFVSRSPSRSMSRARASALETIACFREPVTAV